MKSRANIKGHPIHPMLIPFPIAFFTGTLIFDVIGYINDDQLLWNIGRYLVAAGIIGGLLAAIPGIIDYFFTVPPESSGKKRATKHGLTNTSMLIVFSIAYWYRQHENANAVIVITLEAFGFILMSIAGWMGATLVYSNQIGVDNRYADAGKWKEHKAEKKKGEIEVANIAELQINQMKLILVHDKRIALAKTENGYVAFDDRCTHRGGSLTGGAMICQTVQCPWHGSQFEVEEGNVKAGPAKEKINTYDVKEANGKVYLII